LGTIKEQKRKTVKTAGDKFKQVFVFDWDAAKEDTS
jgi:hypothetical protein